jgi:hypothetical protein
MIPLSSKLPLTSLSLSLRSIFVLIRPTVTASPSIELGSILPLEEQVPLIFFLLPNRMTHKLSFSNAWTNSRHRRRCEHLGL